MQNKTARNIISVVLGVLILITYFLGRDGAEKNKNIYLAMFVLFFIAAVLFGLYRKKYDKPEEDNNNGDNQYEEIYENSIAEHSSAWNRISQSKIFRIALGWLIIFLVFFIPYVVYNGMPTGLTTNWRSITGFIVAVLILFWGSTYIGLFILKLIKGWDYEYEGPKGRGDLRTVIGVAAIIAIFYIGLWVYKFFS